jgi:integrase
MGQLRQDAIHRSVMAGKPAVLRDGGGLLLKVSLRGAAWYFEYRLRGIDPVTSRRRATKLLRLGDYAPALRLDAARRLAASHRVQVDAGRDVLVEHHAERAANLAVTDGMTMTGLIADYRAARSGPWREQTRRAFARDLADIDAALGPLPLPHITRPALNAFLAGFVAAQEDAGHRGTRAQRVKMLLSSLFGYALDTDLVQVSPAQRLRLPASTRIAQRERALDAFEITHTWRTLEQAGTQSALVLLLSLVTGARIGAVAAADESELDLDGSLGPNSDGKPLWRIPGTEGRKSKSVQVVPLSPLAVELWGRALAWPGRPAGAPVFPGRGRSHLRRDSVTGQWSRLRAAGQLPTAANPHDLRRTARSWWSGLPHGQSRETLERLLGHSIGSAIERTYDRAHHLPEQRAVADCWGQWLAERVGASNAEPAVPLRRSA